MILITGGSGFLGINLIRYLLNNGIKNIISFDLIDFDYPEKNQTHQQSYQKPKSIAIS